MLHNGNDRFLAVIAMLSKFHCVWSRLKCYTSYHGNSGQTNENLVGYAL